MIRIEGSSSALTVAAGILGLAVIPITLLLPVYSSGDTLSDQAGGLYYLALGIGMALACLPALVGNSWRNAALVCGVLLLLSSFVTMLGMFFIPAGIALCLAAWTSGAARKSGRSIGDPN